MKTSKTAFSPGWLIVLLRWPLFFSYSFVVVLGAVTPASKVPTFLSRFNDKFIHGAEFFFLFWAAIYALSLETPKRRIVMALIYCAAMGAITEWLQHYVPSRSMSFLDFMADAAGFSLAAVFFHLIRKRGK